MKEKTKDSLRILLFGAILAIPLVVALIGILREGTP